MQKVLRRTLLAEKQAARRSARTKEQDYKIWRKTNREQTQFQNKERTNLIKAARLNRREDYELGPLAPRRDVGTKRDKFGTVSTQMLRGPILEKGQREKAKEFIGGNTMNIVKGDRVVLLEGKDKGKIGMITEVDVLRAEFTVEGLNMIDVAIPEWMISAEEADKRPIRSIPKPVPFNKVRLVHPIMDEETGITRDVIVKELVSTNVWYDPITGKRSWKRVIPGLDLSIPWPKKTAEEIKDHPIDTLRLEVETKTFMPTLLTPPMPASVLDELRNKYSAFRTRHEPEYIAKKVAEENEVWAKKRMAKEMKLTPTKEAGLRERAENRRKGATQFLTHSMKERIGQIIAQNRQMVMDSVGVEKVEPERRAEA